MDETRVDRYKDYRKSFIKEGSISLETPEEASIDVKATTSTLPMEQVMKAVQQEEAKDAILKKKRNTKLIVEIIIAIILVAGLVVLGIFAWGR